MAAPASFATPTLESGDRLSPEEFDRIYAQCSDIRKAELIDGVVYVASPVHWEGHSEPFTDLLGLLWAYRMRTPGVRAAGDGSLRLDGVRVQPDIALFWDEAHGGKVHKTEDDYLEGPPDLVAEVAGSSASYDLHDKLRVYEWSGVREYIVWRTRDQEIDFFRLRDGAFERVAPDAEGIVESDVFPKLRISITCLLASDPAGAFAALIR